MWGAEMALSPTNDDLASLRREFRRLGFYKPAPLLVSLQWAYNFMLFLAGMLGWWLFETWWLAGIGILVSTLGMSGIGTLAHSAAHGAAFAGRRSNAFLAYFGFPFMLMVSLSYWRCKHHGQHHPNPNVVGVDDDCDLMPFFAMAEEDVLSAGKIGRFYYRHVQGWIFPLAVTFNVINMQRASWASVIARMRKDRFDQPDDWLDLISLAAHVGVWILGPCILLSPIEGLLLYFLRIGLLGHFAFFILAPAHFPNEADLIMVTTDSRNFVMRQLQGTLNFRPGGLIGRLACNGLEYQIEHHLFPNICHVYYPLIAPLLREFCLRNGYPYRSLSWGEGILKSYAAIFRPRAARRPRARSVLSPIRTPREEPKNLLC
jgi:linoleoyl-CoA desaturase